METDQPDVVGELSFGRLTHGDLPLVERWLADPEVARWWDSIDGVIEALDVLERDDGTHECEPWLVFLDVRPVGFLQWYRPAWWPEWWPGLEPAESVVAIDIAIGEAALRGRGLGRRVIEAFLEQVLTEVAPGFTEVWIDPEPTNEQAIRTYRAVGFTDTGVDLPDLERPGALRRHMVLHLPG